MKISFLALLLIAVHAVFGQQSDTSALKHTVTLTYDYFHFDKQFADDWHIGGLEYKNETSIGAVLGRFNYANRYNTTGWQAEAEAYPKFSKKVYSYVGIGYSPDMPVFPKFRGGFSLFFNLPKANELEAGFRYLYFDKGIWVGVLGVGHYWGNWFLNARTFISENNGVDFSTLLTLRRYFGEMNDYAWVQVGTGVTPDENRNVNLNNQNLDSRRFSVGIRKSIRRKNLVILSAGYSRDEYISGIYGNQVFGTIGYARRF